MKGIVISIRDLVSRQKSFAKLSHRKGRLIAVQIASPYSAQKGSTHLQITTYTRFEILAFTNLMYSGSLLIQTLSKTSCRVGYWHGAFI